MRTGIKRVFEHVDLGAQHVSVIVSAVERDDFIARRERRLGLLELKVRLAAAQQQRRALDGVVRRHVLESSGQMRDEIGPLASAFERVGPLDGLLHLTQRLVHPTTRRVLWIRLEASLKHSVARTKEKRG